MIKNRSGDKETTSTAHEPGMPHPDDARLICRASEALFPGAPSALLARSCDKPVPKATARSWRQGRRRAPLPVLRRIHRLLQERLLSAMTSGVCLASRLGVRANGRIVEDLWKFACATVLALCHVMLAIDGDGRDALADTRQRPSLAQRSLRLSCVYLANGESR
jgi:hypothetical protein